MSFLKQLLATPRNPYIPNWDKIDPMEVEFSGCKLRLDFPPGSHPDFKDEIHAPFDIYNSVYEDDSDLKWFNKSNISEISVGHRAIGIKGKPWKSTDLTFLQVSILIYKVNDLPENMTCLNPSHFIQVIDKLNFFSYGPNSPGPLNNSFYSTNCNWKILRKNNIEWIFSEVIWNYEKNLKSLPKDSILSTPIDDKNFLCIYFSAADSYSPVEDCIYAYENIISQLIDRVLLTLSESLCKKGKKC